MFPTSPSLRRFHISPFRTLLLIVLLSFPIFFYRLGSWPLFDADEGRYAAVPREMVVSGDYVTPYLNHIKFFDKPPLLYWTIAGSYQLLGFNELAARFIPALAGLLGVVFAWLLGRRMFGERAGLFAAVILSTSLLWPLLSRVVITDMLVTSMLFVALALWWLGHVEENRNRQTVFFLGFWSAMALAVLSKGPVTLVLAGGSLFFYFLFCRQWKALKQMRWLPGMALFFLIATPWFVAVALRNPEFNYYFWYDQHIARFMGQSMSGPDHIKGIDYYLKLLPVIFFPWTFFLPAAILAAIPALRATNSPQRRAGIFLLSGILFTTSFYSSSSSKLITYLLPLLPPVAILLGAYFDRLASQQQVGLRHRTLWIASLVLAAALAVGSVAAWLQGAPRVLELGASGTVVAAACAVLLLWSIGLLFVFFRRRPSELLLATGGGCTAMLVSGYFLIAGIAPQFTTPSLIAHIQPGIDAGAEVVTLPFTQSVGFYSRERVEILGPVSELDFGLLQMSPDERSAWVFDEDLDEKAMLQRVQRDLASSKPLYIVVRKKDEAEQLLENLATPPIKLIENQRFVVIANEAAAALTPPKLASTNGSGVPNSSVVQ